LGTKYQINKSRYIKLNLVENKNKKVCLGTTDNNNNISELITLEK